MIKRNANYTNLAKGYLFPEIAKRRREYQAAHPDAKIISTNWQMKNVPTKSRPNCLAINISNFFIRNVITF